MHKWEVGISSGNQGLTRCAFLVTYLGETSYDLWPGIICGARTLTGCSSSVNDILLVPRWLVSVRKNVWPTGRPAIGNQELRPR